MATATLNHHATPHRPPAPSVATKQRRRRPFVSAWRRLTTAMARVLPDDQRVCLLESLRLTRPIIDAPSVQLHVSSEPELSRLQSVRKEPWTARWINEFIKPGDVVYDIGANVGAYALLAAKVTKHRARVYAFEP